ncbi:PH domain-containing protein [Cellulomonas massiliensis]|uniref:PH domain-containing protein n=1 Tax=Cellulomonas massiliensis TaxID=1465811 RepID=UPI000475218A|nr:PH domain-containing protein [Cellulomonas massiliensis]
MPYPRSALTPEERLLLHRHPHVKMLFGSGGTLVLVTALAAWLLTWVQGQVPRPSWGTAALVAAGVVWLVVLVWFLVRLLAWSTTHFVVTDRRVMYRHGILTRTGIDIPLLRINSVQFEHGLVDRVLRTGTLMIESASDDPLSFADIPRVEEVHTLLYSAVHDSLDGDDDDEPGAAPRA